MMSVADIGGEGRAPSQARYIWEVCGHDPIRLGAVSLRGIGWIGHAAARWRPRHIARFGPRLSKSASRNVRHAAWCARQIVADFRLHSEINVTMA